MKIIFNFEGGDEGAAFYTLYASLRKFKEEKAKNNTHEQYSICAGEAFCMLEEMKEQFPKEYAEAEEEFRMVYQ